MQQYIITTMITTTTIIIITTIIPNEIIYEKRKIFLDVFNRSGNGDDLIKLFFSLNFEKL